MLTTLIVLGVIALIAVMVVVGIYNKLVTFKNRFENAFSQIEVQLQRRYDLIPNLIETVKGYMAHEKETLEAVIQARNQAQSSLKMHLKTQEMRERSLTRRCGGLARWSTGKNFRTCGKLPDLKANQNMANLQKSLVLPKTKSLSPDKRSTMQLPLTIPTSKLFLRSFLPPCLVTLKTLPFWNLTVRRLRMLQRSNSNY